MTQRTTNQTPVQTPADPLETFITHWSAASAYERANSQPFLCALADILHVERPHNTFEHGYAFEFPVTEHQHDASTTQRRIDLYKRGCFVLESKQFQSAQPAPTPVQLSAAALGANILRKRSTPTRGTDQWDDAMTRARGQAERYIRALPADEPNPPFLIVADVGECLEIYADFTQAGKAYLPFPDPRHFRIRLADLRDEKARERLRLIWSDPLSLDPSRHSADVTREIAGHLAELAKSLEAAGHPAQTVAEFLTRCLFCMFAEDVGLLPDRGFTQLLAEIPENGTGFQPLLQQLFREMNTGTGFSTILRQKLLQFNGGLFADDTVLPVDRYQLHLLRSAAGLNWRNVEPAIFGTLLERALNPRERHKLGAHYTPRAYVERLVLPTVIEPLRDDWESVRAAAVTHARLGHLKEAAKEVRAFHQQLCQVKVLDPACGSGNFLYVTLEHMKRLEGEVLLELEKFGDQELTFEMQHFSVDPHQFLGIEVNPRAASIAELVLWIGYLQWHFRTRGHTMPSEPILKKFKNIECRDAVLAWNGDPEPKLDEHGHPITVWDRRSYKKDPVTGRDIPDESKRIPLLTYKNPRPAEWPQADFIVGNPPFLGNKRMREVLGDGYAETLRGVYSDVAETADYVMYWWNKAADTVRAGKATAFGLITTNSLTQTFNRRVVASNLNTQPSVSLVFAIADHPWVDTAEGAAVRIAMTVVQKGMRAGEVYKIVEEEPHDDGSANVTFRMATGKIAPDLSVGADASSTVALASNEGLCFQGFILVGEGFCLSLNELRKLGFDSGKLPPVLKSWMNGRDLLQKENERYGIDFFGLTAEEARAKYPTLFQHLLTHVKPHRDQVNRKGHREKWWIWGEARPGMRRALEGLRRFIATVETSKHKPFVFLPSSIGPDHKLYVIASDDAFHLGILSSRIHSSWALSTGGTLEDRPTWTNTTCFRPFPFPDCAEPQRDRIRQIAEELDAHRKRVQAQHPGLTLTGMYNVLEKLRVGEPLTPKEKTIHDHGLVSVLKQLHGDLDAAVFDAYGWPPTLTDPQILEHLVALNAERAQEEAQGQIRWLRPDYQIPLFQKTKTPTPSFPSLSSVRTPVKTRRATKQPWPKTLPERAKAIQSALHAAPAPITAAELAKNFRRANPADITEILETLCAIGHAHHGPAPATYLP